MLDKSEAEIFVGKTVLVGMTYTFNDGTLKERKEFFGTIVRINEGEGIVISLAAGGEFRLPPDLRALQEAPKGEYRLHSTGELIINPDLLSIWTLTKAPSA